MTQAIRRTALASLLALAPAFAAAQVSSGIYQFGAFDTPGLDTIDVGSLNAVFSLPVLHKAGRAGTNFTYDLVYNSSIWVPAGVSGSQTWTPVTNFGWLGQTQVVTGYETQQQISNTCSTSQGKFPSNTTYGPRYYDTAGIEHRWSGSIQDSGGQCPGDHDTLSNTRSLDGKYKLGQGGYPIYDVVGNIVQPSSSPNGGVGSYTDTNGNQISTDGNGHFTDTTGATVLTIAGTSPQTYTYKDTSGNPQNVTVSYKTYAVRTAFGCPGVSEYSNGSVPLIDTISYADGSAYHFAYEPTPGSGSSGAVTGRLSGIQLPTGGVVSYSYTEGSNGIVCADGSAAGLRRTLAADSGSAASTWTYTRTPGAGTSHTDVVDGNGNSIAYDFVKPGGTASTTALFYKTNRNAWNGGKNGAPVYSGQVCFNNAGAACTTTAVNWPITQTDTYNTYDGLQQAGATTNYNTYNEITGVKTYDYGAGSVSTTNSRGGVLSSEVLTYGSAVAPANLLAADVLYDAAGNLVNIGSYGYDQTTPAASSGIPSHTSASGSRGNLTTVSTNTASGVTLSNTMTYEDTGTLLSSTDSINGKTQFNYDGTLTFNTGIVLPTPSSGVGIAISTAFDTGNTGLPWSITDPNGAVTRVASYDAMLRPLEVDNPDGGKTSFVYRGPSQTGVLTQRDSSHVTQTETQYDSYGRASRVALAPVTGGNAWYQHDTCYDASGNVSFVSYKYQGGGWGTTKVCSGAGDAYNYDVLGRMTLVKHGDGTQVAYQYAGRATRMTDENGVTRVSQIDGLGRITTVCEISSNIIQGASPGACGTDIAGTGFVTSYGYDLANHKTTVSQGVQTRVFQTDWIGRPIMASEPERGTTTYAYSNNSTGLVVTRTKPQANQNNASVTTTTTTQYDTLGRPVQVAYSDGTPERYFRYDSNTGWYVPQTNLKGRLAAAYTTLLGNNDTSVFSYDAMGRTLYVGHCFPFTCGNVNDTNKDSRGSYDWEGNLTAQNDITDGTVTYSYSDANEVTGITGATANAGSQGTLLSNVQNGPFGPISYQLGNGLGEYLTYDALGRNTGRWLCSAGGAPGHYCPNSPQVYGTEIARSGDRVVRNCGTTTGCHNYGYDEFDRLQSSVGTDGTTQSFTWTYDRYGNRWQQTVTAGSGPQPQFQFDPNTNRIVGYGYDAAGNVISDGAHSYSYDAEGNLTAVDGGQTASYSYDVLNRRFRVQNAQNTVDYQFDVLGRHSIVWQENRNFGIRDSYWWGGAVFAYHALNNTSVYEQQDWLGTERARTDQNGNALATYTSLPFGDGFANSGGSDEVQDHYAGTERDNESATDNAQFRQYGETAGRWMSPDRYDGSYDPSNPQSLNRYSYVLNNPLSYFDPLGLQNIQDPGNGGGGGGGGDPYVPCSIADSCVTGVPPADPTPCSLDCGPIGGGTGHGPTQLPNDPDGGGRSGYLPPRRTLPPVAPSNGQTWKQFGQATKSCAKSSFGASAAAGVGALAAGSNILSTGTKIGSFTPGTSLASQFFRNVLPQRIGPTLAPTLMNPLAESSILGGVVGRWVPVVGEALLVVNGANFVSCLWDSDSNY